MGYTLKNMAMKWVGLTGGIGTGKSTVAKCLRQRGYVVVDADQLAREAIKKDSPGLKAVLQAFGPRLLSPDGELDRQALAKIVFDDQMALEKLERIVHPIVRMLTETTKKKLSVEGETCAFYDVPLLFEKNMEALFDLLVVVVSEEHAQVERLKKRNAWSEQEIKKRIARQLPLADKKTKAHFVVVNDGSLEDLEAQVDKLLEFLKVPMKNPRSG